MDCNLPELPAGDLEASKSVFASIHMTAGTPVTQTSLGSRSHHQSTLLEPASHEAHFLGRVRAAGGIGSISHIADGYSTSWLDQSEASSPDECAEIAGQGPPREAFEVSDCTSHPSDFDVEPPSIPYRQQPVTAATTSIPPHRRSSAMSHMPMSSADTNGAGSSRLNEHNSHLVFTIPDFPWPHTSSGSPSEEEQPKPSTEMPAAIIRGRRSSLSRRVPCQIYLHSQHTPPAAVARDLLHFAFNATSPHSFLEMPGSPRKMEEETAVPYPAILRKPMPCHNPEPGAEDEPGTIYTRVADEDDDSRSIGHPGKEIRDAPSAPGLVNVRVGVDSSVDVAYQPPRPARGNMVAAAVPLPREMIETLMVSVTAFPEAMLITSNYAIETIRTYSRKMRRAAAAAGDDGALIFATSEASSSRIKRWKLPMILFSSKIGPSSSFARTPEGAYHVRPPQVVSPCPDSISLTPDGTTAGVGGPESHHIKAVFPGGSTYLCNALYAYLVAYNYVSSLCAPPPKSCRSGGANKPHKAPPSPPSSSDDDDDEAGGPRPRRSTDDHGRCIPSKAATLLGLSNGTASGSGPSPGSKGAIHGGFPSARTAELEGALRQLQAGLMACIGRLVSTLKLTDGYMGANVPLSAEAAKEVDPLFMRALCEIVRGAEELY